MVTSTEKRSQLGPISVTEVYPAEVFKERTGMNRYAFANARRHGLKVKKIGMRLWVSGSDWLDFVQNAPAQ